jgi:hypothetical protein
LVDEGVVSNKSDLPANRILDDFAILEIRSGRQRCLLPFRIRALEQHVLEGQLHGPTVRGAAVQTIHVSDNLFPRGVLGKINDDGLPNGLWECGSDLTA